MDQNNAKVWLKWISIWCCKALTMHQQMDFNFLKEKLYEPHCAIICIFFLLKTLVGIFYTFQLLSLVMDNIICNCIQIETIFPSVPLHKRTFGNVELAFAYENFKKLLLLTTITSFINRWFIQLTFEVDCNHNHKDELTTTSCAM